MHNTIDFVAIGKRIKAIRKQKGLSQESVAEYAKLSTNYITVLENGRSKPSIQTLILIAEILGTTTDQILYDNLPILKDQYDADAKVILSDCSEKEKAYLLAMMKYAKEQLRENNLE